MALNPAVDCNSTSNQLSLYVPLSLCIVGRVVLATNDYSNIANPARTAVLKTLVDAIAVIDSFLPPIFR